MPCILLIILQFDFISFFPPHRATSILQGGIAKRKGGGGSFSLSILWTVQSWCVSAVEKKQAATQSQQKVRGEAGRLPPPAPHQGAQTRGRRQLLVSRWKCSNVRSCDGERCVQCWSCSKISLNKSKIIILKYFGGLNNVVRFSIKKLHLPTQFKLTFLRGASVLQAKPTRCAGWGGSISLSVLRAV